MGKEENARRKFDIARNRGKQKNERLKSRLKCLRKRVGREGKERKGSIEGLFEKFADTLKKYVVSGIPQNSPNLQTGEDRQWLKKLVVF